MAHQHPTLTRFARWLRPAPERFAAAAALQDPNLLLRLRAAQAHAQRRAR
jgi:hypothetical protein